MTAIEFFKEKSNKAHPVCVPRPINGSLFTKEQMIAFATMYAEQLMRPYDAPTYYQMTKVTNVIQTSDGKKTIVELDHSISYTVTEHQVEDMMKEEPFRKLKETGSLIVGGLQFTRL